MNAPFDISKPYRTRDGRRAWAAKSPEPFGAYERCLYSGWIEDPQLGRAGAAWDAAGRAAYGASEGDLVNEPEPMVRQRGWINVYAEGAMLHCTEADARRSAGTKVLATAIPIEYEIPASVAEKIQEK